MSKKKTVAAVVVEEAVKTVNEVSEKKTRIRRGFKSIIMDKVDLKAEKAGIDSEDQYLEFRSKLSNLMSEFDDMLDLMKAEKKHAKSAMRKLSKFSKEEIEAYLASING